MKPFNFIILCSLSIALGLSLISSPIAYGKVLWMDDFEDGKIDAKYVMMNHPGKWVEEDGVIKQTNPAPGDHTYLIIPGDFPEPHTGIVLIRIDDWSDHDLSRALFCESVILIVSHPLKKKMGTRENETWRRINNGTQGDTTQS